MKWIAILISLMCAILVKATVVSDDKLNTKLDGSGKDFIAEVQKALAYKNLDSLDHLFSNFIRQKIELSRLDEGHTVLNQIVFNKSFSDTLKILAYKNKAVLFGQIDLTKKRAAFESAIQIIETKGCLPEFLPFYQLEIAKTHISQSRFLDATQMLNKVDFNAISDPEKQVEIMGVSGQLYSIMEDSTKAMNVFNEALKIAVKNKDYFGLGTINSSIGNSKVNVSRNFKGAMPYFRKSISAFEKAGYPHYALGSQVDLGISHSRINAYDSAFYYLEKSYDKAKSMGSSYDLAICAMELGVLHNKLGEPQKALTLCLEAKELNWEYSSNNFRKSCSSCLAKAYEAINDFKSAFHYLKLNLAYADSSSNKSQANAVAKFNAELEKQVFVAEQEKVNFEKDQILKTRNLLITFLSILSVLIVVLFLLILWVVKNRKKREVIELKEKNQREFVKSLLQSLEDERKRVSMELHDSVGQILVVAGRNIANQQFDHVAPMLQNALNEVRTISQGLHPYVLEKMGLQDAILNLIHAADNSNDLFIESEVDLSHSQLSKEQEIHVYRIVQELISNCLKHAQSPSLQIEIESNDEQIKIFMSDNGIGFDTHQLDKKKTMSLGMKTLHERVELLKGTINFESKPNRGTTVTVIIPSKP